MERIYNKAKNTSVEDFIFSYKDNYLELLWNNNPYVVSNPLCYYNERIEFEERISDKKKRLESLKSENIESYYSRMKEHHQWCVNQFEKDLSLEEKGKVFFLLDYLQNINKWNPNSSELQLIKSTINVEIQIQINKSYDDNYVYSKLYNITEAKRYIKQEIEATENEIEIYENHIRFRNEFDLKKDEYLNKFKTSIKKDIDV